MKLIVACAALLLAGTAAHAGDTYSFEIGGRSVYIDAPNGCNSASCISVSIPGVFEYGPKRGKRARVNSRIDQEDAEAPAPAKPANSAPAQSSQPSQSAVATQAATPPVAAKSEPQATRPAPTPTSDQAVPSVSERSPAVSSSAPTVVATAPATTPLPAQEAPRAAVQQAANSPIGVWRTEENEGKVRIEQCGANLCGYSVNARTNENAEKVLINMRPTGDKWNGRIHDPKGGSTYDSTIALKGPDRLRVQGCAFGGMFCGGQTWTRVN